MSSTLPPPPPTGPPAGGPPSGPPGPPPSGPPEFLDSAGGGPVPPQGGGSSGLKRGLLVGGGLVGLGAVAVGAWAAYGFLSTGPQPAEALPADTLAYASIDLDPSGGQKIEALRTLNKFPAFEDEVGIGDDEDLRKALFDKIQEEAQCESLDWEDDVEPWLGDRAAVAAVDNGGEDPDPVFVVQTTDTDAAEDGMKALQECGDAESFGWSFSGDWVVIGETGDITDQVVDATGKGSLADDADFQQWTEEAGGAGIVSMYAGPAAGDWLADNASELFSFGSDLACAPGVLPEGLLGGTDEASPGADPYGDEYEGDYGDPGCLPGSGAGDGSDTATADEMAQRFRDFQGLAITVRFADGAVEIESAGDASAGFSGVLSAGGTADVVESLPADTGAVLGVGFADGWFGDLVDQLAPQLGQGTAEDLMAQMSDLTGLDLPEDAETLAGDSAALAIGSDLDPEAVFESEDGSDVPVGLKVKGDADEIDSVLDKLREAAGPGAALLESDSEGDTVAIGPNPDYRASLLEDGGLGEEDVFKDAVRDADDAQTILFVNLDALADVVREAGAPSELVENLEPIAGFGVSGRVDDDVAHAVIRLTTD